MLTAENDILKALGAYTPNQLTEAEKRPPQFFVESMIPVGLSCIIGAPKTRKSFFALQMCLAVATGSDFLGFETTRTGCLYFDLEGSKSRTAARLSRMQDVPGNLLITHSNKLKICDGSLLKAIMSVHEQHPEIQMYVCDTYGRCRGSFNTGGLDAYSTDINLLTPLQEAAQQMQIALIFVHHTRKGASAVDDIFERASGSMGLTGTADSVINITLDGKSRAEGVANIDISPRDVQAQNFEIQFDKATLQWIKTPVLQSSLRGMPIPAFCISHAPESGHGAEFFSYSQMFKAAYRTTEAPQNCGAKIREIISENREALFTEHGIAVQCGARTNADRGCRIMRV